MPLTMPLETAAGRGGREATPRHYLMCRPDHFEVTYAINPWMDPSVPVDRALALAQWENLRSVYEAHGHRVDVVEALPGLPDMVFAANGGLAHGDRAMAATFAFPERRPESAAFRDWFTAAGYATTVQASDVNEGEGDFLRVGGTLLAGTGFRTAPRAHREVADFFGLPVVSLALVDPRFYHLDTALAVLDATTVAYYPGAFAETTLTRLRALFPDALLVTESDALTFGLNAVSDGRTVFLAAAATGLHEALRARGFDPVGIDLSELLKAGGSVKCCTLEIHPNR